MRPGELADAILVLLGICIWDFVTSLWFEYRLLTRKLPFRWEFVPYFLARYSLIAYITLNSFEVLTDPDTLSPCTRAALFTSIYSVGMLGIVFSTWNLLMRTIIIWGHHPLVMKLLFATGLFHLTLALFVSCIGRPPCVPLPPRDTIIRVFAIMTAILEFAILVLSVVGIRRVSRHRKSPLARFLQAQGVAYFFVMFLLQMIVVIMGFTRADQNVRLFLGVFSAAFVPILSCRLVTSTLSQNHQTDSNSEAPMHHIERFELSEDRAQDRSTRITTFIDISKDSSVY